jgi:hypothetical protein
MHLKHLSDEQGHRSQLRLPLHEPHQKDVQYRYRKLPCRDDLQ